jgi:hypothetical protein
MRFTLSGLVVVGHLQAGLAEAALDVEAFVGFAAVEDGLVAADLLGDVVEGLDDAEAELLALLVLGDGNVLDVADGAEAMDARGGLATSPTRRQWRPWMKGGRDAQLALRDESAGGDDGLLCARRILNDNDVVAARGAHGLKLLGELLLGELADRGQHTQAVEEAGVVVGRAQGAQAVALGQLGDDLWRHEVIGEEADVGGNGNSTHRVEGGDLAC